jgi:RimJ/RimL family protein N-acetyltransferase
LVQVHAVSISEFLRFPDDPEDFPSTVAELWESGRSGPDLCFVAERGGQRVGRIGFFSEPTLPQGVAAELGDLPAREAWAFGLSLPWQRDWRDTGVGLLAGALEGVCALLPDEPQLRINADVHSHPELRREVVEAAGFDLLQEKEGVLWTGDAPRIQVPDRLRFRTMPDVGSEFLAELVSRVGDGTLDRNDRYYFTRMAPRDWGRVYVSFFESSELTLVGFRDEEAVGFAAVSSFDGADTATIVFIGIVPEHRGNGYVDDLLLAATDAATRAGYRRILSDVDVENRPMLAAMERCGHPAAATPWHIWHYRADRTG